MNNVLMVSPQQHREIEKLIRGHVSMTRKQAVNHVRNTRGATDPDGFHVRSRVVRGERRIEIHSRSLAMFQSGRGDYKMRVSNGRVMVFASRRSWDHAARQAGELR